MVQYGGRLDRTFAALADGTRRGILERLGREESSISTLASTFEISLTGVKKHVSILEDAGLVSTRKVGRVRLCRLEPNRLDEVNAWIEAYRRVIEERYDHLELLLGNLEEESDDHSD